eukprot:6180485-Pleurochrysis_carterae.AAC.12
MHTPSHENPSDSAKSRYKVPSRVTKFVRRDLLPGGLLYTHILERDSTSLAGGELRPSYEYMGRRVRPSRERVQVRARRRLVCSEIAHDNYVCVQG